MPHHASFRRGFMILTLLALALILSFFADSAVEQFMRTEQNKTVRLAARRISRWGDGPILVIGGLGALGFAVARRDRRTTRLVAIMLLSAVAAGVGANAVRGATCRARPDADEVSGWHGPIHGGKWVVGTRDFSSFPSAHTSVAFAFFVPLLFVAARRAGVSRLAQILAVTSAALIGWARLYLSVHHLSDIVAGAILGVSCAMLASCSRPSWQIRNWFRHRMSGFVSLPSTPIRAGITVRSREVPARPSETAEIA